SSADVWCGGADGDGYAGKAVDGSDEGWCWLGADDGDATLAPLLAETGDVPGAHLEVALEDQLFGADFLHRELLGRDRVARHTLVVVKEGAIRLHALVPQ